MWGFVNLLQFVVFMTNWKLDYPANAFSVLKSIKYIALMEFLSTAWFTDTLSKWFNIQIGSKENIFENMGMMLLIGCSVAVVVVIVLAFSLVAVLNYKIFRIYKMLLDMIFYNTFARYILQSILKLINGSLTTITSDKFGSTCDKRCLKEAAGEDK
jgi:sensor histidine kinase YesM